MNHSKPGLNEPFYKWLDDVRRAIRKEKELKEKLAYYNVKLIGYKGVTYDRIGSAGTAGGEKDLYYWMDKIDSVLHSIDENNRIQEEYRLFKKTLSNEEVEFILEIENLSNALLMNRSRSKHYNMLNTIARKWLKYP